MASLLQQLLTESAERHPEKIAVWARGGGLRYQELDESSNQLAYLLRQRGVKKGDRIGLYSSKSVESVVSMFGVLKAGGIYVPLDPLAPSQRVSYIIGDCAMKGLITTYELLRTLDPAAIEPLDFSIALDSTAAAESPDVIPWNALSGFSRSNLSENQSVSTDLAYILYTSGSTGRPKGVMISHLNAMTFVDWCAETFHIRTDDHLSNHAPLHFDLSVFDIYDAIKAGATVSMIREEDSLFPTTVASFIELQGITIWYSVPSALVYLLLHAKLKIENLKRLRLVLFAGEVFAVKYLRQLVGLLPSAEFYNLYGPTETNVCTYYRVDRSRLASMDRLPIGKACTNTEVFAVDERDNLIQPGQTGELYVRGPSVTTGYWGDQEKTRQAVLPNRFQPHFEEKIYRTGDLVTLGEDGNYDFIGRRDSMIKSRGYRIELGDVEAALLSHPSVREAAAIGVPDEQIGARIKALVALHTPNSLTPIELQQHCSSRIPKYMIPEVIEFCESLPKTSTGKVDRVRLAQAATPRNG